MTAFIETEKSDLRHFFDIKYTIFDTSGSNDDIKLSSDGIPMNIQKKSKWEVMRKNLENKLQKYSLKNTSLLTPKEIIELVDLEHSMINDFSSHILDRILNYYRGLGVDSDLTRSVLVSDTLGKIRTPSIRILVFFIILIFF